MLTIRLFELRVKGLFESGKLPGFVHISTGQEAIAVGVCDVLRNNDFVTSTHRGHGHCLAKGVDMNAMMAELYGKHEGSSKGKGGSMHIFDFQVGMLGANGIVGAGGPIAVGAALSAKLRGSDQVCICFFGDGAMNQGAFLEALNMAPLWKLPLVFVCENNFFAQFTHHKDDTAVEEIERRASGFGLRTEVVDGMDVLAVRSAAKKAIEVARAGKGSAFLECKTYRYSGHYLGDPEVYRSKKDLDEWRMKDPVSLFETLLTNNGILQSSLRDQMNNSIQAKVEDAVRFAESGSTPEPSELLEDVYSSTP